MVYYNALYNWVGFHPLYNPTNQGFFHCSIEKPLKKKTRKLERLEALRLGGGCFRFDFLDFNCSVILSLKIRLSTHWCNQIDPSKNLRLFKATYC